MQVWVVWLIIGVLLVVGEMTTLTFYLLWLGVGALIAAVLAWFIPDALLLQVIVGSLAAIGLTVFTKPLTRKVRESKGYTDVINDLVGKHGIVTTAITEEGTGIVKIGNETWTATAEEALDEGTHVVVVERSSTVVKVQKL